MAHLKREEVEYTDRNVTKYLLEHLATFTVSNDSGVLCPADGMRRLLQLEKSTGIWSQKMQLSIDPEFLLIIDYESGSVIERFPTSLIKDPTAFTSNDALELYNNILIFIVSSINNTRAEMHIFQSQSVSAVELVEVFKNVGKVTSDDFSNEFSMKHTENTKFYKENEKIYESHRNLDKNTSDKEIRNDEIIHQESDIETVQGLESSPGLNDIYEKDVSVLNHCFDDIEKFIARLQHAAAASRELERRRKSRKTKKKYPGEGLLSIRTKPPQEREFIDIFSKFKLSFNLLAKLKSHIHDPNAPELVHFLFTPLALIVEAANETYYDLQLSAEVVNPLLTREAINLLINCVTSKETELWRSLGEAWFIPKDQWKESSKGFYHPVFLNGWSPDFIINEEPQNLLNAKKGSRLKVPDTNEIPDNSNDFRDTESCFGMNEREKDSYESSVNQLTDAVDNININNGAIGYNTRAEIGRSTIVGNVQQTPRSNLMFKEHTLVNWLTDLQNSGSKIVQVTYPRTANNDKELSVARGEFLEILDDSRKWWKARNFYGQIAHVPHTIVASYMNTDYISNDNIH